MAAVTGQMCASARPATAPTVAPARTSDAMTRAVRTVGTLSPASRGPTGRRLHAVGTLARDALTNVAQLLCRAPSRTRARCVRRQQLEVRFADADHLHVGDRA